MQQTRKTLGLKSPSAPTVAEEPPASEVEHLLRTAMVMKVCVAAVYNRSTIRIAPHILYTRHGEPFMDGVVLERDGNPPRELKLGAFKLAGLSDVRLTAISFKLMALFDIAEPRYAGTTLATAKVGL